MYYTIAITYDRIKDDGAKSRARSVYQIEVEDNATLDIVYQKAEKELGPGFKLGACLRGRHMVMP